jgi:hypothetical protein
MDELLRRFLGDCRDDYLEMLIERKSDDPEEVSWTEEELEQIKVQFDRFLGRNK